MFDCSRLRHSVVGFIISHIVNYFTCVSRSSFFVLLILLGLLLGAVLAAASGVHQLVIEVVVVVLVEVGIRHDDGTCWQLEKWT